MFTFKKRLIINTRAYRVNHQVKTPDVKEMLSFLFAGMAGFEKSIIQPRTKGMVRLERQLDNGQIEYKIFNLLK